jgi:hypothetical protein
MGFFYFDESIHERAGFILGAYVYSAEDISPLVNDCLISLGLRPGEDEFKSSSLMIEDERQRKLRDMLKQLLKNVKIGLVVVPSMEREDLGVEALRGLKKISDANGLTSQHQEVYFDEGIIFKNQIETIRDFDLDTFCSLFFDKDSRKIGGLQLADLVAHTLSVMLLETLGFVKKTVKVGHNSGYDPDLDVELGFELWASIRYSFFTQDKIDLEADPIEGITLETKPYAVHTSSSCTSALCEAVQERFGTMYIGCIH